MKNREQDKQQGGKKAPQTEVPANTTKHPDDWATGDESMTGAQRSYLQTLSQEAGEQTPDDLSKAEASKKIDELQHQTGRGVDH